MVTGPTSDAPSRERPGAAGVRPRRWPGRPDEGLPATLIAGALAGVMLLPIATILVLSLSPQQTIWPHLFGTVLPRAVANTLLMMAGVGALALVIGTGTAWLVTMYRFPGRSLLDRLLVLPLAMPTYIVAYCYVEVFDYSGPVQTALRALFGWQSARDYWFPEIRTLPGCILVLSTVLYPYVYLAARASFAQQSVCVLEVARTLGQTAIGAFRTVAMPLARPALAAGVALTAMECLNDLGAAQYLGIETLTVSIYTTWLQRSNLAGAAQLALVALVGVLALLLAERALRGGARVHHTTGRYRAIPFSDLAGWRAGLVVAGCAVPVTAGLTTVGVGLALVYARRLSGNRLARSVVRLASLGYAMPGTVLALGLMLPLAMLDNAVDAGLRAWLGVSSGLILSGSLFVIVLAYTVRFLAIALGSIEAGFDKLSPNLDAVARTLGESALSCLRRVHVPLLLPALAAAALLVFVDGMKELPATLLLRPFNFETL